MTKQELGILPYYEALYLQAMMFNTRAACDAISRVNAALKEVDEDLNEDRFERMDRGELLDSLQDIVIRGAALSRYFWPSRKKSVHQARATFLRSALGMTEDSPLKDRGIRDQIEHFDERLDAYLHSAEVSGMVFPDYVGPLPKDDKSAVILRAYYVDEGIFEILGERYKINPIAGEVVRIHKRLLYCDAHGGRLKGTEAIG